jgi:WD40 repeat protein
LIVTPFGSETVQRNLPAKGNVERVAWSPDGSILAVSDEYGALGFWKTDQWALAREIADRTAVFGNVGAGASSGLGGWSPDARWLACSNGKMLRILDGKRFEVAREFPYPGIPSWSPSGTMLLSSLPLITADCDVTVLDPVSGEKRGKLSTRRGGAAWLPGKDAIIVSTARLLELYDSATLTRQGRAADLGGRAGVRAVISPDGSRVVSARDGKAMLWAAETGQLLRQMSNFSEVLGDWSPSGKWIAGRPSGKELVLVDPDDPSQRIALASGSVTDWSWSPDRNFGASSGRDKKVRIWDLTTGKQQHELDHVDELFGVAWSPDGKHLASVTKDSLQLWDATSYAAIRTIKPLPGGRDDRHTILSWSPDSQLLFLTVHASVVYAYDVAGGTVRPYWSITGAQHVDGGSFSPDGKKFAAVDTYVQRGWVLYRDTQETVKINSFARLRWLPDSRRLIGGDDGATNLYGYDTETNRKLGVLLPSMSDKQYVCIGPDGHYRGSPQIDDHIVYVALHEDGSQVTYAPKEFREKFGWKNDPDKARFLALDPPDSTPPSDRPLSAEVTIEPPKTPGGPRTPRFAPDPVTVKPGQPLSVRALVSQPAAIPGLRSWSLELAGGEGKWLSSLEYSPDGQRIAVTDARDVNNADAGVGLSPRIRLYDRQCRLRRVLLGHEAVVSDASWSPDGQYLASTGDDKTVRFWEAATGRLLRTLPLESPGVALRWSPDGKRLAVAGDRRACLIDVQTKRTDCFGPSRRWHSVGWSADGQRVAIGSNEGFQVWAAQTLALAFERKSPEGKLTHIAWSPDGRWIAGAHAEKTITLWETDREAQRTLSLPEHRPYRLAWSAKSDRLVSTGIDSWVMVWDVASGKPALQSCDRTRNDAAWSPDGQTFAIAPGGLLQVLDAGSGNVLNRQPAAGQIATRASGVLAPDGRTVQVRRGDALVLFDLEAGKVCDTWPNIPVGPRFASPSGDRIAILAGSGADSLQILDATQLQLKAWSAGHAKPARVAAWSPDGKRLATGSDDQIAVVWDAATGQPEKKLEHPCAVAAVAWSRDGQWLATGGADRQIRLWSTGDFTLGRTCGPLASGFSDDRRWPLMEWNRIDSLLAAALGDGSVVLVKPQSGEVSQPVLKFSQAAAAVEWSRDGSALLASSSPDMVGVWKVPERQAVYLDARLAGPNAFFARWLPDSRRILLGCQAAPFKQVYDVAAGRRLGLLVPTIGDDQWVIISPEGHYRGTRRIDEHLVYVALTEDGAQETYTPSAFRAKFGWKNDPDKAWLLGSPAPAAGAPATPPAGAAPPK